MANHGTGWREEIGPDEEERFEQLAKQLVPGDTARGRTLHRHAHVALHGTLQVHDELPSSVAQGLGARPGRYECYVRFSSGSGAVQPDRVPDQRGLAIKVVGVEGTKVIPGLEAASTQDFLAILPRTFPFADPEIFVGVVLAVRDGGPPALVKFLVRRLGLLRGLGTVLRLARSQDKGKQSMAERTFFVPVPIRWGDSAAKLRFRPLDAAATTSMPTGDRHLGDELRARVAASPLRFAMDVQLFADERSTPIEDPSVEWREELSPFVEVARLEVPVQDTDSAEGRRLSEVVEKLSFDPWHALEEHRPLGAVMRARGAAYRVSTMARDATSELEVVAPSSLGGA